MTTFFTSRRLLFLLLSPLFMGAIGRASSLTYADGYNVFTLGALHATSDIGGRVAAGGTVSGTFDVGTHLISSPAQFDFVAGSGIANESQVKIDSVGKAFVTNGSVPGNIIMNGGGSLVTGGSNPVDFDAARNYFYQLSGGLAMLNATGAFSNGSIQATSAGLNVFNITAAEFLGLSSIATNGGTIVINVSGASSLSGQNMTVVGQQNVAGQTIGSKVLFNFYQDSGTLMLPNVFGGSVLAPFATVAGTSQFNGTIVSNSLNFQGEIHGDGEFDGDLTHTPEPLSIGLAGAGLLLAFGAKKARLLRA